MGHGVKLTEVVEKMDLKNLTPKVELVGREGNVPDVNRPALQLVGFFDHFDSNRVQIIGYVEYNNLKKLSEDVKTKVYHELLEYKHENQQVTYGHAYMRYVQRNKFKSSCQQHFNTTP